MTDPGMFRENLRTIVDTSHNARRGLGVVMCDVLEDIFHPQLGFPSPSQPGHERILLRISSLDIVRPASASSSPRRTMSLKASSRTSSSPR